MRETMRGIATRPSRQALRHEAGALGQLVTRTASADVKGEACGPHNLRHTYALRGLLTAANVVQVSKLLGHSSITTTSNMSIAWASRSSALLCQRCRL
jgi:integrase